MPHLTLSYRYELYHPIQLPGVYKEDLIGYITGLLYGIKPHPFDPQSTSISHLLVQMTLITGVAVTVIAMNICILTW